MSAEESAESLSTSLLVDVSVSVLLDNARESVMRCRRIGVEPDAIAVSPEMHAALLHTKRDELRRGRELGVLGKRILVDEHLTRESVEVLDLAGTS